MGPPVAGLTGTVNPLGGGVVNTLGGGGGLFGGTAVNQTKPLGGGLFGSGFNTTATASSGEINLYLLSLNLIEWDCLSGSASQRFVISCIPSIIWYFILT